MNDRHGFLGFTGRIALAAGLALALALAPRGARAVTGGDVTNDIAGWRVHTFTNSGTLTVDRPIIADVLLVGGGGAGGLVFTSSYTIAAGTSTAKDRRPLAPTLDAEGCPPHL